MPTACKISKTIKAIYQTKYRICVINISNLSTVVHSVGIYQRKPGNDYEPALFLTRGLNIVSEEEASEFTGAA